MFGKRHYCPDCNAIFSVENGDPNRCPICGDRYITEYRPRLISEQEWEEKLIEGFRKALFPNSG